MTLSTHVSDQATPGDRGLVFGKVNARAVHHTVAAYERLFRAAHSFTRSEVEQFGERVGDQLHGRFPDLVDEIAAIASGAGVSERLLLAVNARTEILAGTGRPECSVLAFRPDHPASSSTIMAQNWDWHPDLKDALVLWRIVEPSGRWLETLTEAGILAKIGLNSRGLGVCLNILSSTADGDVGGIPIHVLLRLVLQGCDDLGQATDLLVNARTSASSCLTIGSAKAGAEGIRGFEISPGGTEILNPGAGGWLAHTNHFCVALADGHDRYRVDYPDTLDRLDELERRMADKDGPLTADDLKRFLRSHDLTPIAVCCHDPDNARYLDRQETLVSVVLDLTERRLLVTDGSPCTANYSEPLSAAHVDYAAS